MARLLHTLDLRMAIAAPPHAPTLGDRDHAVAPLRLPRGAAVGSAATLAAAACALYVSTLMPGMDLGDTASFQTIVTHSAPSPRDAYPLYFAIGKVFVALGARTGMEAAGALNLASAVTAAIGCGVLAWAGMLLTGSVVAGLFAAALVGVSYTFWSQAVIAEVYALHVLFMGASIGAVLAWRTRPTLPRLAVFFASVALSFTNHLSTVLLLPAFAAFLLVSAPGGPSQMLRPRVLLLALGVASLGMLPYAWNLSALYTARPALPVDEALRIMWFDVTKADWRETLVMGVSWWSAPDRIAMYWFDLKQQFGMAGALLAPIGAIFLVLREWRLAVLLLGSYGAALAFAFTYNVGDVHVFYIPSHVIVALLAGVGLLTVVAALRTLSPAPGTLSPVLVLVAALSYPVWRAIDTFPALDRSDDRRPTATFDRLTDGLDGQTMVFGADLNWQLLNGLRYYRRHVRPDLELLGFSQALGSLPALVEKHGSEGRRVVLNAGAAAAASDAYRHQIRIERDPVTAVPPLRSRVARLEPGTPYVLTYLTRDPDFPLDEADLVASVRLLAGVTLPRRRYNVIAGRAGESPALVAASDRPFRFKTQLDGRTLDVRMESWLPADTMRRAGFGHVIVNRRRALIIERGVSFVALDGTGAPSITEYAGGLFAPQERYWAGVVGSETLGF